MNKSKVLCSFAIKSLLVGLLVLGGSDLSAQTETYDTIIRNGRIIDGAGNPWFLGDVAIRGDEIVGVGKIGDAAAKHTIDAAGKIVAPGFIDVHNHSRRQMFRVPNGENFIRQGVTTVVEGNDGSSPVPLAPFFEKVKQTHLAVNFASFIGHGSVRRAVIGEEDRRATLEEMDRMKALVKEGMVQGALGLSSGLFYIPGAFASTEEVIELSKMAALHGGIYISHMRDESAGLLNSVRETIEIGEKGGLPTQLTHHKVIGAGNWGQSVETIQLVEAARKRGVDVSIDQYPYTASFTGSAALFPQWAQEGGHQKLLERLKNPATRRKIKAEVAQRIEVDRGGGDPQNVQLAFCEWDTTLNGKSLADVTRDRGRVSTFENAAETAIEIQQAGGCRAIYHAMNEQDVERIIQYPGTMIASDGGILVFKEGVPHPRNYGTFPRVLGQYVREKGLLRLEDALRKMTSLPAQRVQLFDRGLLRPGMKADISIFDEEKILDRAEFGKPHQYAEGISHVLVNGVVVLDNGKMSPARPGTVLYGPGRRVD